MFISVLSSIEVGPDEVTGTGGIETSIVIDKADCMHVWVGCLLREGPLILL